MMWKEKCKGGVESIDKQQRESSRRVEDLIQRAWLTK